MKKYQKVNFWCFKILDREFLIFFAIFLSSNDHQERVYPAASLILFVKIRLSPTVHFYSIFLTRFHGELDLLLLRYIFPLLTTFFSSPHWNWAWKMILSFIWFRALTYIRIPHTPHVIHCYSPFDGVSSWTEKFSPFYWILLLKRKILNYIFLLFIYVCWKLPAGECFLFVE